MKPWYMVTRDLTAQRTIVLRGEVVEGTVSFWGPGDRLYAQLTVEQCEMIERTGILYGPPSWTRIFRR